VKANKPQLVAYRSPPRRRRWRLDTVRLALGGCALLLSLLAFAEAHVLSDLVAWDAWDLPPSDVDSWSRQQKTITRRWFWVTSCCSLLAAGMGLWLIVGSLSRTSDTPDPISTDGA
jgi:hypothetical protein